MLTTVRRQIPPIPPTVYVVDRDPEVRNSLANQLRVEGCRVEAFESAEAFLSRPRLRTPSCLVIDIDLHGVGALEVQRHVAVSRPETLVIFIAGRCDVRVLVDAMKAGASEFLMKPINPDALSGAVQQAIQASQCALEQEAELQELRDNYATLSGREREVMTLVVAGRLNKQIGGELGISEITVKAHRGQVMRKTGAGSLAELVQIAILLGVVGGQADGRRHDGVTMALAS